MSDRKYFIMSSIYETLNILSEIDDDMILVFKEIFSFDENLREKIQKKIENISELLGSINDNKRFAVKQLNELKDTLLRDESIEGGDFLYVDAGTNKQDV